MTAFLQENQHSSQAMVTLGGGQVVPAATPVTVDSAAVKVVKREELKLPADSLQGGAGTEAEIDPGTFSVIQVRKNKKLDMKHVALIVAAILANRRPPRILIYEDIDTGERFSPDGAHRRDAFGQLGMNVPVIIIRVKGAKQRAILDAEHANSGNGRSRTNEDLRLQAKQAYDRIKREMGREPTVAELLEATRASRPFCSDFLRKEYAAAHAVECEETLNLEDQIPVVEKLRKALDLLKAVKPKNGWSAGEEVKDVLDEIRSEAIKIAKIKRREETITPEQLEEFRDKHSLTLEKMAEVFETSHPTISRWLKGKIPDNKVPKIRAVMKFTAEQIATILTGGADER